jgi:hypothetical protein
VKFELAFNAIKLEHKFGRLRDENRAMDPFAAEIVGAALMQRLRIGTSPCVEIVSRDEARRRGHGRCWILKTSGGRACFDPSQFSDPMLAVKKIPGAIPLARLRDRFGIDRRDFSYLLEVQGRPHPRMSFEPTLFAGKPPIPGANEFYSDFAAPQDWSAVRTNIEWDSFAMLRIHAARLFLCSTTAHASNILVDAAGTLYSIDHADCVVTSGTELPALAQAVAPGTRAHEALRSISSLSERQLAMLFNDGRIFRHYARRLERWKQVFAE